MTEPDRVIVNTILVNYSKAIAAYMRLLVSRDAPFDRWIGASDNTAIERRRRTRRQAVRGQGALHHLPLGSALFRRQVPQHRRAADRRERVPPPTTDALPMGRSCSARRSTSNGVFSDDTNTGRLAGLTNPMPDRHEEPLSDAGAARRPLTAPYMHAGQLATLKPWSTSTTSAAAPRAGERRTVR